MSRKTISIRKFAANIGVGEKTIRDGIRLKKLTAGVVYDDNGKPSIIEELAREECERIGLGYRAKLRKETAAVEVVEPKRKVEQKQKDVDSEIDDEEWDGMDKNTTLANAQKAEKIFKAKLAYMDVEERKGSLVRKDEVYNQLYNFANEVKNGLLSIPDRYTDDLIALADDRNAFHARLNEAISEELERLSRFDKI